MEKLLDSEFKDTPIILLPGGGAEQDPEGWWNAIMSTSKKLLGKGLVSPEDIVAVSVTTQWSGTVARGSGRQSFDERHHLDGLQGL